MEEQKKDEIEKQVDQKKTKLNFILNILYKLFFAVVIIIVIFLVISKFDLPGNFKVLIVQSGSMEPAIKTGSVVVVKAKNEYKIQDVITFSGKNRSSIPTTHRIVDIKEENGQKIFITKGDANDMNDLSDTSEKRVIGKVLFSIPYIGYAIATAQKPTGFIFLIGLPALLIVYDEIIKIFKEIKKILNKKRAEKKELDEKSDK